MTVSNQFLNGHLSNDLLVRSMDEELSGAETVRVDNHLASCEECRARMEDLRHVSDRLDSLLHSLQPSWSTGERAAVASRMETVGQREPATGTIKTLARFGWALAVAATLAVGVSYIPFSRYFPNGQPVRLATSARASSVGAPFEIDGETFQYLPYSNPDLPLGGSHIVQMQVPLSSLADAGVLVQPTASRIATPDRAVLADVLLGLDGQPIGVHVLSAD